MAGPPNPFSGFTQRDGAMGSAGHGRGAAIGRPTTYQARNTNTTTPRDPKLQGRGRGASAGTKFTRGRGRGAGAAGNTWRKKLETQTNSTSNAVSPFASLKHDTPPAGRTAETSSFAGFGKASPQPFGLPPNLDGTMIDSSRDPRKRSFLQPMNSDTGPNVPVEDASFMTRYNERYEQLKIERARQRDRAIKDGQMADPNQPTSLKQAITPVGTCTSMCPDFERVERIVQKMVDKSEKFLHPSTGSLQNMELKMLKRFRRSAAGYDEQLPSDIRTPETLLQTMNYLVRHVIGGPEPLGLIHKFVWDRTRSIRNDFSVQQLTQEEHVKIAVTCLERIARFHIVSLHLLSSPANEEPFDRHQEREQLNNTMLSLMYYYDDNRGRILFPNEDEFRAYYIIFSIHDQRPDLEARVQRWPPELRNSPRVQVALNLFAAAGNTWEYQGTLDAKRPNAIAQGFYARFFSLVDSPGVSYLMACVAEIYFNHMRQTAIRSIWKGYCRYPSSQQHKNEEWTIDELTTVLYFDDDDQTIKFCEDQDLEFAENTDGNLYLNWGSRPVDSVAFQPSSDHSFSEHYVESKRAGRNLIAIILGLDIKEATRLGMVESSLLSQRILDSFAPHLEASGGNDDSLFVSDDDNGIPVSSFHANEPVTQDASVNGAPTPTFNPSTAFSAFSQTANRPEPNHNPTFTFGQPPNQSPPSGSTNPFGSLFSSSNSTNTFVNPAVSAPPASPALNPFAKAFSPHTSSGTLETNQSTIPSPAMAKEQKPSSIFSGINAFTPQNDRDKASTAPSNTSIFSFSKAPHPSTTTLPASPFNISQAPPDNKSTKVTSSNAAQSSMNSFNFANPPPISENPQPPFGFSDQGATQNEVESKRSQAAFAQPSNQDSNLPVSSPSFPVLFNAKKNESTSVFPTTSPSPVPKDFKLEKPAVPTTPSIGQRSLFTTQTTPVAKTEVVEETVLPKDDALVPINISISQQESSHHSEFRIPDMRASIKSPVGDQLDISLIDSTVPKEDDIGRQPPDVIERRIAWIEALKEAADKRRETVLSPTPRKRVLDEQEPLHVENDAKAPKVSKPETPPLRKSMALSSIKPLPKLPILEMVESITAQKPTEKKPEAPKSSQIDEDELLLSAARIAAESLRSGPRILDGWSASYEHAQSAFSPGSSVTSSVAFSRSQSPQSYINGYDVALAPDNDLGLGRTMSRTEQRIRLTGGKGLAYKPLNFTSKKPRKTPKK